MLAEPWPPQPLPYSSSCSIGFHRLAEKRRRRLRRAVPDLSDELMAEIFSRRLRSVSKRRLSISSHSRSIRSHRHRHRHRHRSVSGLCRKITTFSMLPCRSHRPPPDLDDDMMTEILLRLPAKSVARFRCVSKRWLSVSSHPKFLRAHHFRHHSLSGFFLSTGCRKSTYFSMDPSRPLPALFHPILSLPGIVARAANSITMDSFCNDFVLYRSREEATRAIIPSRVKSQPLVYVCNLKTLEYTTFTTPEKPIGWSHIVIFDPFRSPDHYKVISSGNRMHLYSSETQSWKLLFDPSPLPNAVKSVYWDGSLVWMSRGLLRLDVEGECVSTMPWPGEEKSCHYLGESRGRLHFIGSPRRRGVLASTSFNVFEMESVGSKWSVLHHVDLGAIYGVYSEVIIPHPPPSQEVGEHNVTYPRISVVYFHRGFGGEGSGDQLLLSIPGKIVSYNLQAKTFMTVADNVVGQNENAETLSSETEYRWWEFYPHAPSLSSLLVSSPMPLSGYMTLFFS